MVEQRQELIGVVPADPREHDRDVVVGECLMQVLGAGLGRSRHPALAPSGVRHQADAQPERLEIGRSPLDAVRPAAHGAERRGDDRDRVADLHARRLREAPHRANLTRNDDGRPFVGPAVSPRKHRATALRHL